MGERGDRLEAALARIDDANGEDPTVVEHDGARVAKELLYARRMSARLAALAPDASEALQLAVRAQHIQRWKIPRASRPEGTTGYKQWRSELARMHAELTGRILRDVGYGDDVVARVGALVQKRGLGRDAEAQTLEDVACLVFLEHYFTEFASEHAPDKVIDIVRKTWRKMSERARREALALAPGLPTPARALLERALGSEET